MLEQYWSHLDAAVIGLGGPPQSGGLFVDEISERYNRGARRFRRGRRHPLSYFFRPDGGVYHFGHAYGRSRSMFARIHRVRKVICLAGGQDKVEGIIAASRLGYINTLITDSVTAKIFYDKFRSGGVDKHEGIGIYGGTQSGGAGSSARRSVRRSRARLRYLRNRLEKLSPRASEFYTALHFRA
jgi:hypothetical protein